MTFDPGRFDPEIISISMGGYYRNEMHTFSGGLEMLQGDTIRSLTDLGVRVAAFHIASLKGYGRQIIEDGWQRIEDNPWSEWDFLPDVGEKAVISHYGRNLYVGARVFLEKGVTGFVNPVNFLTTALEQNSPDDRTITDRLYDGNCANRIAQENALGQAGIQLAYKLGYKNVKTVVINEGHGAFAPLELARQLGSFDVAKELCVFITHTPEGCAYERWDYELARAIAGNFLPDNIPDYAGKDNLDMTQLILKLSRDVKAVSRSHGNLCKQMDSFKGYNVGHVTNGIHPRTWILYQIAYLLDSIPEMRNWRFSPEVFANAPCSIRPSQMLEAKYAAKSAAVNYLNHRYGMDLNPDVMTVVWARRFAPYKRPQLLLREREKLEKIAEEVGPINIIYAGEAHPNDDEGKWLIKYVFDQSQIKSKNLSITFLQGYDPCLAKLLMALADFWLNTPRRPSEASGTSGMKAAVNGVLNMSTHDGWVGEGYELDPKSFFIIGEKKDRITFNYDREAEDNADAKSLYEELGEAGRLFYSDPYLRNTEMGRRQTHALALVSHFNTHRVVREHAPDWRIELK